MKNKNSFDPGTGARFQKRTKRIINKDGTFNVVKHGAKFRLNEAYLIFIDMSWGAFLVSLFSGYVGVNLLFAFIYSTLGEDALSISLEGDFSERFLHCFFFSAQTFTTVGYGAISPISKSASLIASFEALVGFLSFSLATGLLFGRFSKPSANIRFSKHALLHPVKGKRALVFRVTNERPSQLLEMKASVILNLTNPAASGITRSYSSLELQIDRIQFFPLNWTLVHFIDEKSPLVHMTDEEIQASEGELLILLKGYDEMFAQEVLKRFSYTLSELLINRVFKPIFKTNDDGDIVLDIDEIDATEEIPSS